MGKTTLDTAWASVEHDGWEVVWLGRRLRRPTSRRWLAQAVRYNTYAEPRSRDQAWGETATEALVALSEKIASRRV